MEKDCYEITKAEYMKNTKCAIRALEDLLAHKRWEYMVSQKEKTHYVEEKKK